MVDIMLVLLVIFIITAPLLTNAVKIDLPHASSAPNVTKADNIQLAIDADGQLYWDGEKLDRATVLQRLHDAARKQPTPELHLRADRDTHYDVIADVMSEAGKAGLTKRSEEHTSELQSLMRISYAVFCLKNTKKPQTKTKNA